jgi:hypothetical protein
LQIELLHTYINEKGVENLKGIESLSTLYMSHPALWFPKKYGITSSTPRGVNPLKISNKTTSSGFVI